MNEVIMVTPSAGEASAERDVRLHWGSLIGGIAVALGVWLLLTFLGLAVGLSSLDPRDSMSAVRDVGIGTGIWTIVVSVISLFVGGLIAAKTAGFLDRKTGAIHGAVLWALATILSVILVGGVVRDVVRGTLNTAGAAVNAASQAGGDVGQMLGIDANTLLAPINERLAAAGKPTLTSEELAAALEAAAGSAIREGRLDRDILVGSLAESTRLSRNDAADIARRIETRVAPAATGLAEGVTAGAMNVADAIGKAMFWAFLAMLLGLGASVLGATLGVNRRTRARDVAEPTEAPPIVTTREAHT